MRKFIYHLGRIMATGCLSFSIAQADLTDGLVGYYSFNDGAGDVLTEQTGNGTDGELFNFEFDGESDWAEGQIGGALSFDGVDDYVIAQNFPLANTALSVSIWGFANNADNNWMSLVKNWGGSMAGQFHFGLGTGAADTLNIFVTQADGTAVNVGTDADDIELEVWEHYAFVANPADGAVILYRNGEVVSEDVYDGGFTAEPNSQAIGIGVKTNNAGDMADPGNPGYWNGRMDDLGIWHRALTTEEITNIYARGLAGSSFLEPPGEPGDFNNDGAVDFADFEILTSNFNMSFPFQESFEKGDADLNGRVDLTDFLRFREVFSEAQAGGQAAAVPEPATVLLAALGLAATPLFCKRRKT